MIAGLSACGNGESSNRQRNATLEGSSTSVAFGGDSSTTVPEPGSTSVASNSSSTVPANSDSTIAGFRKSWIAFTWMSTDTVAQKDTLVVRYAKPTGSNVAGTVKVRIAGVASPITTFDAGLDSVAKEIEVSGFTKSTRFEFEFVASGTELPNSTFADVQPQCSEGTFSATGLGPCTPAPAGSFVSVAGATSSTKCLKGTYQDQVGQRTCVNAPPGSMVPKDGAIAASGPIAEVITSEHISAIFDIPITVTREGDRFFARSHS